VGDAVERSAGGDPRPALHGPILTVSPGRFLRFAAIDWSGAIGDRLPGIAVAEIGMEGSPALRGAPGRWSRRAVAEWLEAEAEAEAPLLVGIDASLALPFADAGAYFPGWDRSPADAAALWRLVERMNRSDQTLGAAAMLAEPAVAAHFRQRGTAGFAGLGRLRVTENRCRSEGFGPAISSFNLVGPAQVGKSSLAAMRLIEQLRGKLAVWPFDPLPDRGPALVELYTTIAARAAGIGPSRSKLRDAPTLDAALAALSVALHGPLASYDDHSTDALIAAAWLRNAAGDDRLWSPPDLTPALARTEGWTFGVP
jgi:hypothetical protein